MPLPSYYPKTDEYCVPGRYLKMEYKVKPREIIELINEIYRPLIESKSYLIGYTREDWPDRKFVITKEQFVKLKLKYGFNFFFDNDITVAKTNQITFCKRKIV